MRGIKSYTILPKAIHISLFLLMYSVIKSAESHVQVDLLHRSREDPLAPTTSANIILCPDKMVVGYLGRTVCIAFFTRQSSIATNKTHNQTFCYKNLHLLSKSNCEIERFFAIARFVVELCRASF